MSEDRKKRNNQYRNQNTNCFVPHCKTGCQSESGKRPSIFSVPKDPVMRKKWNQVIARADKDLKTTSAVCELHFEPRFIERHFRHVVNGEEVLILRDRPRLTKDAIPTLFPGLPGYVSRLIPSELKKSGGQSVKNIGGTSNKGGEWVCYEGSDDQSMEEDADSPGIIVDSRGMEILPPIDVNIRGVSLKDLFDVELPSEFWVKIKYPNNSGVFSFATFSSHENILPEKRLVVEDKGFKFLGTVYFNNVKEREVTFSEKEDLIELLNSTFVKHACLGVGEEHDFVSINMNSDFTVFDGVIRRNDCEGAVEKGFKRCKTCIQYRKAMYKDMHKNVIK